MLHGAAPILALRASTTALGATRAALYAAAEEPMKVHHGAALCAGPAAAAALPRAEDSGGGEDDDEKGQQVSIASLSRTAFGARMSAFCTLAFVTQVVSMITAQLVKTAEIASVVSGGAVPYYAGCLVPAVLFGALTLRGSSHMVERINTALTAAILGGFGLLCNNALASGGHSLARLTGTAQWGLLLPGAQATWALPVLLSVLQFGAAIPVVVQSMQAHTTPANAKKARTALLVGASLPLSLGLLWTAVVASAPPLASASAGGALAAAHGASDPVLALLLGPRAVALPVCALSAGAIGTTLIGAYWTLSQLFGDVLPPRQAAAAVLLAVLVPAVVGTYGGTSLYLPLLGLSGAFPCTMLYVLLPPLALLLLRRRGVGSPLPAWLPGGAKGLLSLAAVPAAMLTASASILVAPFKAPALRVLVRVVASLKPLIAGWIAVIRALLIRLLAA